MTKSALFGLLAVLATVSACGSDDSLESDTRKVCQVLVNCGSWSDGGVDECVNQNMGDVENRGNECKTAYAEFMACAAGLEANAICVNHEAAFNGCEAKLAHSDEVCAVQQ